jgi:hypothetical protein
MNGQAPGFFIFTRLKTIFIVIFLLTFSQTRLFFIYTTLRFKLPVSQEGTPVSRFRFSQGAGNIFLVLALGAFIISIYPSIFFSGFPLRSGWPQTIAALISLIIFATFLIGLGIYPLFRNPRLLTPQALGEAVLLLAVVFAFWGLCILIFELSPGKFNSHPVSRAACVTYFIMAGVLSIIGGGAVWWERRGKVGKI